MKEFLKNVKKTSFYTTGSKKDIVKIIIILLLIVFINALLPILAAQSIIYLTNDFLDKLIFMSILICVVDILARIFSALNDVYSEKVLKKISLLLVTDFGKKVLKLTNNTLDAKGTGFFIRRLQDDIGVVAKSLTDFIFSITNILSCFGVFIIILFISPIFFVFYVLVAIFNYLFNKRKVDTYDNDVEIFNKENENVTSFVTELVRGARDIKMLNCEDSFVEELQSRVKKSNNYFYNTMNHLNKNSFISESSLDIFDMLTIILLILLIITNKLDIVHAVIIYNSHHKILNLHRYIDWLLYSAKMFNISARRVFDVMDDNIYEKESFGNKVINKLEGNIKFENVNFSYKDNKVLNDLSFEIKANKTYAITGPSGAGKTTIFNLICKMYEIDSGKILLDNNDINELDRKSIRDNITIISQNPYIFNLSIKENFKLVKENVSDEEIVNACKLACLDDYINELTDGYDTVIGEGGINLSGGQRQRLAIARALVQKTEIILFDEATSALDNVTEKEITKAINNLKGTYTIIMIAHRLSTIINSDEIFYIEDGKVKASGKHKELLNNSIEYKTLYDKEIVK